MANWYDTEPNINGFVVCITNNIALAAKISALFSVDNQYFPVIDPPRVGRPDVSNETIRRINSVAMLHPRQILMAGLTEKEKLELVGKLPLSRLDNIENEDEYQLFENAIAKVQGDRVGFVECRHDQIALGLLLAKYESKLLKVSEKAPLVDEDKIKKYANKDHVIVLDDISGINPVLAANYAFMLSGVVKIVPSVTDEESKSAFLDINDRDNATYIERGNRAKRSLMSQQYKLQAKIKMPELDAKFVTFITSGFPYGYFFPEVPSTHLFSNPDLSLSILKGLMSYKRPTNCALTVDPGFFKDSETDNVNQSLLKMGAVVKTLKGAGASVYKLGLHMDVFPYDLLFICSHAGQTGGRELTIEMQGKDGKPHILVIEVADSFGLTDQGEGMNRIVEVRSQYSFVSLDGYDWADKNKPRGTGIAEKLLTDPDRKNWKILNDRKVKQVRQAVVLRMKDGDFMPMQHSLAGHETPIIFNNACISFDEFAGRFIFAGARAYIGTLVNIDNEYAIKFASEFFKTLDPSKPIPLHLWEVQKRLAKDPKDFFYLHVGVFHTSISMGEKDAKTKLKENINHYINLYKYNDEEKPQFKDKMTNYIRFLNEEFKKL